MKELNNNSTLNSTNDNQQSKTKSIDNLLCKDKWIFKFEWNVRDDLLKLLGEYTKLLFNNKEISSCKKESIKKNKNDLLKLLNKSPLELDEESKFYEICINLDFNFKDEIINQLIKNENLIIYCKNKIDTNIKNKLIEENNHLINKIINLPVGHLNDDVDVVDGQLKSNQSKDEKLKNKSKIEFSNLQNNKIDDLKEEINKLKRKLDDEITKNKKIKIQSNQNNSIEIITHYHHSSSDNSFTHQLNEPHNKEAQSNEENNLSNNEQTDDSQLSLNIVNNSLNDNFDTFGENASLDQIEAYQPDDKENEDCININITDQMIKEAKSKLIRIDKFSSNEIKRKPQLLYLSIYLNQFYTTVIKKKGNKIMLPKFQKKIACEDLRKQLPKKINHLSINLTTRDVGKVVKFTFKDVIKRSIRIVKEVKNYYLYLCRVDHLDDVNNTDNSSYDTQSTEIITHHHHLHQLNSVNSFSNQLNESHNKETQSNEKDNLSNNNEQADDVRLPLNIENNSLDDGFDTFRENTSLDEAEQVDNKENGNNCININITDQMIKEAKSKLIGIKKYSSEFIEMKPQLLYLSIYLNQFYRSIIKKKGNKIKLPKYQKKIDCEDLRKQIPTIINHLSINLKSKEVGKVVKFTFKDVIRKYLSIGKKQKYFYLYLCRVDDLDDVNNTDNSADDTQSTEIITHDDDNHQLSSDISFGNQLNESHNKENQSNEEDNFSNNNEQTDDARLSLNIENNSLNDNFDTFRENASLDQIEDEQLDDKENGNNCININITNQMINEAKTKLIGIHKYSPEFIKNNPQLSYLSIYLNQFYRSIIKKKGNKIMLPKYQKKIDCEDLRKQLPKKINHLSINLSHREVVKVVCFTFKDVINRQLTVGCERRTFYLYLCRVDYLDDVNNTDNSDLDDSNNTDYCSDDTQITEIEF